MYPSCRSRKVRLLGHQNRWKKKVIYPFESQTLWNQNQNILFRGLLTCWYQNFKSCNFKVFSWFVTISFRLGIFARKFVLFAKLRQKYLFRKKSSHTKFCHIFSPALVWNVLFEIFWVWKTFSSSNKLSVIWILCCWLGICVVSSVAMQ